MLATDNLLAYDLFLFQDTTKQTECLIFGVPGKMIPPKDKENMKFGYIITGKDGFKDGFYKMYMPKALLDMMQVKASELAAFIDGSQYSINVTETADGGALISIELSFSTRRVEAGKALPLSLAASKTKIKKGKKTKLFGWLDTKKKGKEVHLYKKESGETEWTHVEHLKTKKKGYFSKKLALSETTKFKTKYLKKNGKAVWSPIVKIKVK
jgi:hypothetical protein